MPGLLATYPSSRYDCELKFRRMSWTQNLLPANFDDRGPIGEAGADRGAKQVPVSGVMEVEGASWAPGVAVGLAASLH